jgi:serine protease Do
MLAGLVERLRRSSVQVLQRGGGGSGIVWDSSGHILTNSHVMRGEQAWVVDSQGRRSRGRVVRRDPERDLALLETGLNAEPALFADSNAVRPGEIAFAIGNPLGLTGAVAFGAIHATGALPFGPKGRWLQADVRLAPGNSGGMLADAEGRVIGVNTMIFHGMGLAVPSNEAAAFISGMNRRARAA